MTGGSLVWLNSCLVAVWDMHCLSDAGVVLDDAEMLGLCVT